MQDNVLSRPDEDRLVKMNRYEQVRIMSEYVLHLDGATSSEKALSGPRIRDLCKLEFHNIKVQSNVFYQRLSDCKKKSDSVIVSDGHKQGYYVSVIAERVSEIEKRDNDLKDEPIEESRRRVQREKSLYSPLVEWLRTEGYQVCDTSSGKTLGEWGNPDITGLMPIQLFNGTAIEVVTIEAKFSRNNWRKWIFEAVSHRRFANRSYFAYAQPYETADKIEDDMHYYCQLYKVGLLTIGLDASIYSAIDAGTIKNVRFQDIEINMIHPAPFTEVHPRPQREFFSKGLGIKDYQELFGWGKKPLDE